jgi:hypothetical protein
MSIKSGALAALVVLAPAFPAAAHATSAEPSVAAEQALAPCAAKPAREGCGLGALLSAANRAGAGDLLSGRSGQFLGSGKKSAIAGAVLGSALSAADAEGGSSAGYGGYSATAMMPGTGGGKTAQIAAVATTAVIGLAKSQAAAPGCAPEPRRFR